MKTFRAATDLRDGFGVCLLFPASWLLLGVGWAIISAGGLWQILGWVIMAPAIAFYAFLVVGGTLSAFSKTFGTNRRVQEFGDEPEYGDPPNGHGG